MTAPAPASTEPTPPGLSRSTRRIGGTLLLLAMAAGLWGLLFTAFGADDKADPLGAKTVDHFDRADRTGLGTAADGSAWRVVAGKWQLVGGTAGGRPALPGGRALAVLDIGPGASRIQAKVAQLEVGWGLTTRFQDARNLWYAKVVDTTGAIGLFVVADGKTSRVALAAGAHATRGSTVELRSDATTVSVRVDGTQVLSRTDARSADTHEVGLVGEATTGTARWDDVEAQITSVPVVTVPPIRGGS